MPRLALCLALLAIAGGCRGLAPAVPLAKGDPRPEALLAAWRAESERRHGLYALARFAVDAPGAGVAGRDLALRTRQRLWLERPARLRVEVLGFLDTTLAVLVTDGDRYAVLDTQERHYEEGPVYEGLLWDTARLDLSPREAVEVILGVPDPGAALVRAGAYQVDDRIRIELADDEGHVQRVVDFGASGELRRLAQQGDGARSGWEASFDDYVEIDGAPFARNVAVRSDTGQAELTLRSVELNPLDSPDTFHLRVPQGIDPTGGDGAAEGG